MNLFLQVTQSAPTFAPCLPHPTPPPANPSPRCRSSTLRPQPTPPTDPPTMSPALIQSTTPARLRNMTRTNRKRRTTARAAFRRVTIAAALAGALTLAAAAWTGAAAASARWTDDATAKAAGYILHNESCTLGEIHHAPAAVRDAAWQKWTSRMTASARTYTQRRSAQETAASARVMDFARGYTDTIDEADLQNASLSAVRAAVESGRLD